MKVVVLAGGTGGHIFPALAVAKALQKKGHEVIWIGAAGGMETKIVPAHQIDLQVIRIQNLRGKGLLRYLFMPLRLLRACLQAHAVLKKEKADLVIGFGGFVSGPGGLAAQFLKIPLIIQEQNAVAGITNRYLAKSAKKVLVGFASALPESRNRIVTGNPVREDLLPLRDIAYAPHEPLHILVVGGSLGAQVFNEIIPQCLTQLAKQQIKPEIWQQTGAKHFAETEARFATSGIAAKVTAFIDNMVDAYAWADLVICRAGALTVAELAAIGKPAVFVPYPHAVDDHQTQNAREAERKGAAILIPQAQLSVEYLTEVLADFINHPAKLQVMAANMQALGQINATQDIVSICENVMIDKAQCYGM